MKSKKKDKSDITNDKGTVDDNSRPIVMSGNLVGYRIEYKSPEDKLWRDHTPDRLQGAVPYPKELPGILDTICMLGYEQALAISWSLRADSSASRNKGIAKLEFRVVAYNIQFNMSAIRMENVID